MDIRTFLTIMKWNCVFLIISILNCVLLGISPSDNWKQKRTMEDKSYVKYNNRFKYESIHHENYVIDKISFEKWPELIKGNEVNYCQKYVDTFFLEKQKRNIESAVFVGMTLHYQKLVAEPVSLVGIRCKISPSAIGRKYVLFIKAPRSDCSYLVRRFIPHSYEVIIVDEICQNNKYTFWSICAGLPVDYNEVACLKGRTRIAKYVNDDPEKRKEYEINHFQNYKSNADDYVNWSESKGANAELLCRELLKKIIPKTNFTELTVTNQRVYLQYSQMNKKVIPVVPVSALKCKIPAKSQRSCFQFIKAPRASCVHLIKHSRSFHTYYQIAKLICDICIFPQNKKRKHIEFVNNQIHSEWHKDLEFHKIKNEQQESEHTDESFDENEIKEPTIIEQTLFQFP